jgi:hypothetical protein
MQDRPSPLETKGIERTDDQLGAAGNDTGSVEIFDAQQPFATGLARAQVAADGGDQGPKMQRTGGRGREAPPVASGQPIIGSGRPGLRTAFRDAHGALGLPRTTWRSVGLPAA